MKVSDANIKSGFLPPTLKVENPTSHNGCSEMNYLGVMNEHHLTHVSRAKQQNTTPTSVSRVTCHVRLTSPTPCSRKLRSNEQGND